MIYIIDDDLSVRRSFQLLLSSANFNFQSFKSAEDFLISYNKGKDDLLILDIHMPDMDGCALLNELKARAIKIPVLIVTAYDEQHSRDCAKEYGAVAYLKKPIDGEALIDLIKYYQKDTVD